MNRFVGVTCAVRVGFDPYTVVAYLKGVMNNKFVPTYLLSFMYLIIFGSNVTIIHRVGFTL